MVHVMTQNMESRNHILHHDWPVVPLLPDAGSGVEPLLQ